MANSKTNLLLHPVVLSYPHVFKATRYQEGDTPKFTCNILISKKDKAMIADIEDAVEAAIEKGKESKFGGKAPSFDKCIEEVLRDGDDPNDANYGKPGYAGCYYVVAKSDEDKPPQVVDKNGKELLQQGQIYPGVIAATDVNFYPFSGRSKGVAVGLNIVFRLKDGDRLGGGRSAKEALKAADFSSYQDDDDTEDDAPRSRRSSRERDDDDRDRPVSRRSARNSDRDEDPPRSSRNSRRNNDDIDPPPSRRSNRNDDDDAPRSRRSGRRNDDDIDGD